MDGAKLRLVRLRKNWSQERASEALNVGVSTYQRWERGETTPYGVNLQSIEDVFGLKAEELGIVYEVAEMPSVSSVSLASFPHLQVFLSQNLDMRLASFASQPFRSYQDSYKRLSRILKEDETMHASNPSHHVSRREALHRLIALPFASLGFEAFVRGETLPATHEIEGILSQCAASLTACWELYRSSGATDTFLAFECASKYLSILNILAKQSSQYRKQALDLAARYALLKTLLGWHCVGPVTTIQYAKDAVTFSNESKDVSLQLSAYSKLSWAYFHNKQYDLTLPPAQKAQSLLEQIQSKVTLSPCIIGGTYSTLALMQAKNGYSPDVALGKATELDPGNDCVAFMEFTRSTQLLEAGLARCYQGNQQDAMRWLEMRVDPETLAPRIPQSERGRNQAINIMMLSSLKTRDRDKSRTIHFWKGAIEGAKVIKSEQRFNDAATAYEFMEIAWPDDSEIEDLRELIVHW